jgi:RNA polymerase sigma-70 factor (ECF subfamily)
LSAIPEAAPRSAGPGPSAVEERARRLDAALVRRCRQGDDAAWRAIVERFSAYVYAIATRFGLREDGVEDVYQDVFMRVFTSLDSLRDDAALKPWIAQLTRRAAIDRLRSGLPATFALHSDRLSDDEPEFEHIEQAMSVYRALAELPSPYREAINLFFLEDRSYRTIAETLGISAGTVASRISRGLAMLRATLADELPVAAAR